jgi:hypothetical protein
MAAFIIFIIAIAVAYLILWTPFVNRLNREVRNLKSSKTVILDLAYEVHADHHSDRGYSKDS